MSQAARVESIEKLKDLRVALCPSDRYRPGRVCSKRTPRSSGSICGSRTSRSATGNRRS